MFKAVWFSGKKPFKKMDKNRKLSSAFLLFKILKRTKTTMNFGMVRCKIFGESAKILPTKINI